MKIKTKIITLLILLFKYSQGFGEFATSVHNPKERLAGVFFTYGVVKYFGKTNIKELDKVFKENIGSVQLKTGIEYNCFLEKLLKCSRNRVNSNTSLCNNKIKNYLLYNKEFDANTINIILKLMSSGRNKVFKKERIWFEKRINQSIEIFNKEQCLLGLCQLWNLIQFYYPYNEKLGSQYDNNFEILNSFYSDSITFDKKQHFFITYQKVASLTKDCHSQIMQQQLDNMVYGEYFPLIGISYVSQNKLILKNYHQSLFNQYKLKIGDTILKINGLSVDSILSKNLYLSCCGDKSYISRYYLLRGQKGDKINIELVNRPGEQIPLMCSLKTNYSNLWDKPKDNLTFINDSAVFVSAGLKKKELKKVLSGNYRHIILDLREYPDKNIVKLINRFNKYNPVCYKSGVISSNGCFNYKIIRYHTNFFAKFARKREGKIYVLQNSRTASWGESELLILKSLDKNRVEFWGQPSSGTLGMAFFFKLEGDIMFRMTTTRQETPDGKVFHQSGIDPDFYYDFSTLNCLEIWDVISKK